MLRVCSRLLKKAQVQGARALRNEAYEQYAAVTKGEVQRSRWAFFSGLRRESVQIEESGIVIEVREQTALVRLKRSSACSGCASAGQCHAGRGESEQLLEARNEAGAAVGDAVRVAVSARAVINASARIYLLPVAGLLVGAGVAQVLAGTFISAPAGANAAGFGGIAGAILGVLLARRVGRQATLGGAPLPRITRIVTDTQIRA